MQRQASMCMSSTTPYDFSNPIVAVSKGNSGPSSFSRLVCLLRHAMSIKLVGTGQFYCPENRQSHMEMTYAICMSFELRCHYDEQQYQVYTGSCWPYSSFNPSSTCS